jgi:hypothetical protein
MDLDGFFFGFTRGSCGDGEGCGIQLFFFHISFKKMVHENPFRLNHAHCHLRIGKKSWVGWDFFFFCQRKHLRVPMIKYMLVRACPM